MSTNTLGFICPFCLTASYNPNDARERYCGRCHRFADDPAPRGEQAMSASLIGDYRPRIEFDCIDCGRLVLAFGYKQVPANRRCSSCDWIMEHVPPEHQHDARERLGVPLAERC